MKILNMLRGISGEFEINRVMGALGSAAYIISVPTFVAWEILYHQRPFNVTEFCLAFPGGLAVCVGSIAAAVSVKDRNVATARVVQDTGAQPGASPTPPTAPKESQP